MNADILIGKMQYPSTHTDCKKEAFPPRSFALSVTTPAPTQITTKIVANTISLCADEAKLRVNDSERHNRSGPHRSQFLNYLAFPYEIEEGARTNLILNPISLRSRS